MKDDQTMPGQPEAERLRELLYNKLENRTTHLVMSRRRKLIQLLETEFNLK